MIGDVILFHLAEDSFNLVGRAPALNWITYHAETGGYDVEVELDQRTALRTDGQRQVVPLPGAGPERDGGDREGARRPAAGAEVLQHDHGRRSPGKQVRALRHGMVGQPGWELFGPWDDERGRARGAARRGRGLRDAPGRRPGVLVEHAGVGLDPVAAAGRVHRRLAEGVSRVAAGGRVRGVGVDRRVVLVADIEDYYFTPWDLGYGSYVKFDHDFIGREALEAMAEGEHRQKVTLALDDDDVTETIGTMFGKGDRAKFMDWPSAVYCMHPSTGSRSTARRSASRPGSATAPTRGRC